jgi:hypothetical protein
MQSLGDILTHVRATVAQKQVTPNRVAHIQPLKRDT